MKIFSPRDAMILGIASRYAGDSQKIVGQIKADDPDVDEIAEVLAKDLKSGPLYKKHQDIVDSIRNDLFLVVE